jgi:DNA-binding transcriptional LysR family regulator
MSGSATQFNRLAYFVAVVDARSFTAAAARLGVSKAVVSQQIARLEASLGITLIARTTRRTEPTAAGTAFHARCVEILRQAEEAVAELGEATREPAGMLRLTATFAYGAAVLAPLVADFRQRYPAVSLELMLSDAKLDLIEHRLDLAVRMGLVGGTGNVARSLGTFDHLIVASPSLARADVTLEAVAALPWVANLALATPLHWQLHGADGATRTIEPKASIAMNSTLAVHGGVLAGAGVSVLPDYLVARDIAQGRLVRLAPDWQLAPGAMNVVFPPGRYRSAPVRAFVDMLVASRRAGGGS